MVAHGSRILVCIALVTAACNKGDTGDASASAKRDGSGAASTADSQPATAPTTPRGKAWALGHRIGLVAMSRALSGKHGPAADKAFAEAEDLAKEFGVELPALPPLKGDRAADGAAALHYALDEAGKPLLAEISKKHGADAAALFEMAFKAETLQMLYIGEPGDKIVEAVANNIKGNTARARLPAELSKPLLEKLAAHVPPEKLGEALDAWERVIAAQLAAERQ